MCICSPVIADVNKDAIKKPGCLLKFNSQQKIIRNLVEGYGLV